MLIPNTCRVSKKVDHRFGSVLSIVIFVKFAIFEMLQFSWARIRFQLFAELFRFSAVDSGQSRDACGGKGDGRIERDAEAIAAKYSMTSL